MKSSYVNIGLILIILAIVLTIFTLGFGVICTGPMFLIGIILFIVGLVLTDEEFKTQRQEPIIHNRFCPKCGRAIPFDANICPYCGHKFD